MSWIYCTYTLFYAIVIVILSNECIKCKQMNVHVQQKLKLQLINIVNLKADVQFGWAKIEIVISWLEVTHAMKWSKFIIHVGRVVNIVCH